MFKPIKLLNSLCSEYNQSNIELKTCNQVNGIDVTLFSKKLCIGSLYTLSKLFVKYIQLNICEYFLNNRRVLMIKKDKHCFFYPSVTQKMIY